MDADHMVCDLVAWERMIQRLGRVNRRGDGDAKVIVVVESEPTPPTAKAKEALAEKIAKRDAANSANKRLDALRKKLSAVQAEKTTFPKRQKKSAAAEAAEGKRKQVEKELRKAISEAQRRIKAFKDADAKVVERYETEIARHRALHRLLKAVEDDGGSLSPDALLRLRERHDLADALHDATTIEPLRPELTRAVVEAWSMTSLEEHPGRPKVDPWLHGFRPNDPPQTTVVWRRYLPVQAESPFDAKAAKRFFEAAPPHTSEQLETETHLGLDWLITRAAAVSEAKGEDVWLAAKQIVAIALTRRGDVKGSWTLDWLSARGKRGKGKKHKDSNEAKKDREQMEELLAGTTLVVDARLGGLVNGLLDDEADPVAEAADDGSTTWLVRPDAADVPVTGFRVRQLHVGDQDDADALRHTTASDGWARRHLFVTQVADGEPSAALAIDGWVDDSATEDERAEANRYQKLDDHQNWAEECARKIAKRLDLDKKYEDLLALAARLHDKGKGTTRWQRAFKAPIDGRPYAKTKGPIDFDILDGYRHELGSLPTVKADAEFKKLSADDQECVLHLIAAHHGFARPVIGTSGCEDAPPSIVEERARAVALRFARLSRRWGPWGLAWWEALLRSADQSASRRNQQAATAQKEQPR
jgi:CRISPR-associated endonuclease/helicase Cas3